MANTNILAFDENTALALTDVFYAVDDPTGTPVNNKALFSTLRTLMSTRAITDVNAATYDLLAADAILHVSYTASGAVTSLTLMTAQVVAGRVITVKDAGGNASANNITIDTEGAETIDGAATAVISSDYSSVTLYCDGSNWFII